MKYSIASCFTCTCIYMYVSSIELLTYMYHVMACMLCYTTYHLPVLSFVLFLIWDYLECNTSNCCHLSNVSSETYSYVKFVMSQGKISSVNCVKFESAMISNDIFSMCHVSYVSMILESCNILDIGRSKCVICLSCQKWWHLFNATVSWL